MSRQRGTVARPIRTPGGGRAGLGNGRTVAGISRRAARAKTAPGMRQTSPSSTQPSPVPRWITRSVSSTAPAGIDGCFSSRA